MSNTSLTVALKHPSRSRLTAINVLHECNLYGYGPEILQKHPDWHSYHKEHLVHCDLPDMEILFPPDYSIQGNEHYLDRQSAKWVHNLFYKSPSYLKFNESNNNS